jgi:hypothetical protein
MPLFGTLKSMPLPDVLQWLGASRKTGTLQVEFNKVAKSIRLKDGQIVGCSSNDPTQRLGHYLLSRGLISENQLRQALSLQERTRRHLGMTLVEMQALSADELAKHLEDKAEEIIFSMFDWTEAVFRFQESSVEEDHLFPVSLRVEDVLLRGLKRLDEMNEIRGVFDDPGIVLAKTEREPPKEILENRMACKLYDACDGERTLAEILLHVHGSEYVVTKFLFELHRNGLARIAGVKTVAEGLPRNPQPEAAPPAPPAASAAPEPATAPATAPAPGAVPAAPPQASRGEAPAPAPPGPAAAAAASVVSAPETTPPASPAAPVAAAAGASDDDLLLDWNPDLDMAAPPEHPSGPEDRGVEALESSDQHRLHSQLEAARRFMGSSKFEEALEILDHLYRRFPGDESLRRMSAEAEAAFVEKAYRHYLPPAKVPVLTKPVDALESEKLSPSEFFLLSRMDGSWDVKSIIQIAPLREADALRTLKRMRENGVIELKDPGVDRG